MLDNLDFFAEVQDFIILLLGAFLGSFVSKKVNQHYLIPNNYSKKSVLTSLLFIPLPILGIFLYLCLIKEFSWFIFIDIVVFYFFYLYYSFEYAPPEFQNQDVLKRFKKGK